MGQCLTPFEVKVIVKSTGEMQVQKVPCGKCENCRKRKVSGWSFRLMQQEKVSESAIFLTLTYDTNNVPITKNGFMGANKRDLQLFFKRLRKIHDKYNIKLKYYAVSEYGGRTNRPHYHIILFNAQTQLMVDNTDRLILEHTDYDGQKQVRCLQWEKGMATFGKVTEASVGYTCKYLAKPSRIPMHKNDDRLREFSLTSKGLASTISLQRWLDGITPISTIECTAILRMEKK